MSINFSNKTTVSTKKLFRDAEFDNILKCVHCGLCLDSCPTYRELEDEKDSPRGRLYLMRGLWEGELQVNKQVIEPLIKILYEYCSRYQRKFYLSSKLSKKSSKSFTSLKFL